MCLSLSTLIRDCEERNVVFRWSTEMIYPWHRRLRPSSCAGSSVYRCSCHILTVGSDFSFLLVLIIGNVKLAALAAEAFIKIVKVRELQRKVWSSLSFCTLRCLGINP